MAQCVTSGGGVCDCLVIVSSSVYSAVSSDKFENR